jgi:predicted RecA/RadA family phage recombinase
MAYDDKGKVISLIAGDTLAAGIVVYLNGTDHTVGIAITNTSFPIGVTADYANSGAACPVVISGIAKCLVAASCAAGEVVGMSTDGAGAIVGVASQNATATSTNVPVVGIALENGTAGAYISVLIQPNAK